jgi:HEAT repeat protein
VRWIARIALVLLLALGGAGAWYGYQHAGVRAPEIPPFYQTAIERLRDANSSVATKLALVSQMGADFSTGATDTLVAASSDPSPQVAVEAVKQLSKRVDERVAAQLIALLESPEFTVRAWAARGLGEAAWRPALPALEARLAREDQAPAERQIRQAIERIQPPAQGGER